MTGKKRENNAKEEEEEEEEEAMSFGRDSIRPKLRTGSHLLAANGSNGSNGASGGLGDEVRLVDDDSEEEEVLIIAGDEELDDDGCRGSGHGANGGHSDDGLEPDLEELWSKSLKETVALIDREVKEKEAALDGMKDKVTSSSSFSIKVVYENINKSIEQIREKTRECHSYLIDAMKGLEEKSDALFSDIQMSSKREAEEKEGMTEKEEEEERNKKLKTRRRVVPQKPVLKEGKVRAKRRLNKKNLCKLLPHKCVLCCHRFKDYEAFKEHRKVCEKRPNAFGENGAASLFSDLKKDCLVCGRLYNATDQRRWPSMDVACAECCAFYDSCCKNPATHYHCILKGINCQFNLGSTKIWCKACWLEKCLQHLQVRPETESGAISQVSDSSDITAQTPSMPNEPSEGRSSPLGSSCDTLRIPRFKQFLQSMKEVKEKGHLQTN